jgi:hypothetical protein
MTDLEDANGLTRRTVLRNGAGAAAGTLLGTTAITGIASARNRVRGLVTMDVSRNDWVYVDERSGERPVRCGSGEPTNTAVHPAAASDQRAAAGGGEGEEGLAYLPTNGEHTEYYRVETANACSADGLSYVALRQPSKGSDEGPLGQLPLPSGLGRSGVR